jgi:hypothetical protein
MNAYKTVGDAELVQILRILSARVLHNHKMVPALHVMRRELRVRYSFSLQHAWNSCFQAVSVFALTTGSYA